MGNPREFAEDPVRSRVAEAAYQLIVSEGVESLTVRTLATAAQTSTMAIYSRFGSIGAVAGAVCERGFSEFADALDAVDTTDNPVADLFARGLTYLRFAADNPRLYTLMFQYNSPEWTGTKRQSLIEHGSPTDSPSGLSAFTTMADAIRRTAPAASPDDLLARTSVLWSEVHGLAMLTIAGHLTDPEGLIARSALTALAVGYDIDREDASRAFDVAAHRSRLS